MSSYILAYEFQTEDAILFLDGKEEIWCPKSTISIEGVEVDEYDSLERGEEVDVEIPDWLAKEQRLL